MSAFPIGLILILLLIIAIMLYLSYVDTHVQQNINQFADIIIIGLGTAGSIVARRLSEGLPNHKIIVLERGRNERHNQVVYNDANGIVAAYNEPFSVVLPSDNANVQVSTASMYGGGSSHNFGLAVRGSPQYYNGLWKQILGLSYEDTIPYFKKVEAYQGKSEAPFLRGTRGKIHVYQLPLQLDTTKMIWPLIKKAFSKGGGGFGTLSKSFNTFTNMGPLRASDNFSNSMMRSIVSLASVPIVEDYNTEVIACTASTSQLFIDPVTGLRSSTDVAYLPNTFIKMDKIGNGQNRNLQLVPNAFVDRIWSDSVEWSDEQGQTRLTNLSQNGRIILCGGGIYSPFLLQKSGITSPHIGSNLINHYGCTMIMAVEADSNEDFNFSSGPLAFVPRIPGNNTRDWQIVSGGEFLLNKKLLEAVGLDKLLEQQKNPKLRFFVFLLWNLKTRTRGQISYDPTDPTGQTVPKVELNMFEDGGLEDNGSDLSSVLDGMKFLYQIKEKMKNTFPSIISVYPPEDVFLEFDDKLLIPYVKEGVSLTDHYLGTCAVGKVVDPFDFSLIGIPHIHVVDASVLPEISDGNTEFPICVIAEVASDRIINSINGSFLKN